MEGGHMVCDGSFLWCREYSFLLHLHSKKPDMKDGKRLDYMQLLHGQYSLHLLAPMNHGQTCGGHQLVL